MIKLSWQMTVLYAIAMIIMGAIIIIGFYNEEAKQLQGYALTLIAAMIGYGGGKAQTMWEIRKANNVRQPQPVAGDGGQDKPPGG